MQADATAPQAAPAAAHDHAHHQRHAAAPVLGASLLGASVLARLAIVAGVAVFLWVTIAWALA